MPVHDWKRVDAVIFHDFHVSWISELRKKLNKDLLPEDYCALAEQHAGRSLAIRHVSAIASLPFSKWSHPQTRIGPGT
jgi:hypothetical protein